MKCVILQPIDRRGLDILTEGGVEPILAPSTDLEVLAPLLAGAEAAITRNWGFPPAAFDLAPALRVLGVHGTGTDRVAMDVARARGIPVVTTPGANAQSVAEHALGLMLAVARGIPASDGAMQAGDYDFRERFRGVELSGLCLGLWGWGKISQLFAPMARALGMRVLVHSTHADPAALAAEGYEVARDVGDLLARADVLSLHGRPGPIPVLGRAEIAAMRPGAILVNTGRGALVDEAALAEALRAGRIFGAGLDVFTREPLPDDSPLYGCPRLIMTPHVGGSTEAALIRTASTVARGIVAALRGWD